MSTVIELTDLCAPELDVYARLTEAQLRSRLEPEKGVFIAESPKVIGTALDAGLEPVSLLMEPRHLEGQGRALMDRCPDVPVYTGAPELLEKLTGYRLSRGILCAMRRPAPADATCCDPLNRRAVRVSMGTVFQIPWAVLERWPQDMNLLRALGFQTAAMALCGDSVSLDDPRLEACGRLAVVLGAEGDGLARSTVAACDYTVRIPMAHGVDSLNVAAASAVAFWQLRRK